jgi:RNA polymerase sigma factor (sigma-70 family)
MDDSEWLAGRFEENRTHLRAVAYRMLGSLTEVDDAVQDAWERVSRAGAEDVDNLKAWLTTIVARVCLNMLRSRNTQREESLEVAVPDPIVSLEGGLDPEEEVLLTDSVGLALQVVIDTLGPAERLAFVLHDMFDRPSRRSRRWSGARLRQPDSSPAEHVAESRGRRFPRQSAISPVNDRWWTPSSQPAVRVTSTPSWPCSIPTSWPVPTSARAARAAPW